MVISTQLFSFAALISLTQSACVNFELDLTWEVGAPNGQEREMIFVNGQFPGPPIIVDEGDDVTVTVNNRLPFNTTVHFHGIEQKNTAWADGVPGLNQWAIQPNFSYTYQWHANQYGTYWYHSHDMATLQDGLYGPVRIRPSRSRENPFSTITNDTNEIEAMKAAEQHAELIMVSDWSQYTSFDYMEAMKKTGYDIFCSDSILIQGKGSLYCPSQEELNSLIIDSVKMALNITSVTDKGCLPFVTGSQGLWKHNPEQLPPGLNDGCVPSNGLKAVFEVDPAYGWASLNFVGGASEKALVVSIDEHPMWVYEVDGRYIEPQYAHTLEMYNGERYAVLIKLDKEPAQYNITIANDGGNQIIAAYATLQYVGGEETARQSNPYINYGGQPTSSDVIPLNVSTLPPFPPVYPAKYADDFYLLNLSRINSSWEWSLDGTKFLPADLDSMEPVYFNPSSPELANALKITTRNNTWVDIVFQIHIDDPTVTPLQPPHPIHKHSNKMFLIGSGQGVFNWTSIEEGIKASPESFFLDRPLYRDTFVTSPRGIAWIAIRYFVENPGPFFLHCHMETHLWSGMGMVLMDGADVWGEMEADSWSQC
ncbi:conidial pigment biosynthesis oxidase Arb2 [Talaromyces proteolyticus]|uniref:Conidial pigment biosynthesis oxidase Arb2 n=1 Tax=Talaromyces proteolyticus TaxID=1131652 RepID=A0AAD4KXH4_9EURO|nr:conidial pigment biosynthesis oxidase Arb2 [Talaromyces proteolyticus]KAH8702106.1 conidial pigment biosynthesis oxidase Arb2 [Talaromyces proteolyticus]